MAISWASRDSLKDECARGAKEKAPHPLPGRGPSLLHGVLVFHAGGFISFVLHASVKLKKCCIGKGRTNCGRLKMQQGGCRRGGVEWVSGLRVERGKGKEEER